jgi:hypothetical protein
MLLGRLLHVVGKITKLTLHIDRPKLSAEDEQKLKAGMLKRASDP